MRVPSAYCAPSRADAFRTRKESDDNFNEICNRPTNDALLNGLLRKAEAEQKAALERRLNTVPIHHWLGIKLARLALSKVDFTTTSAQPTPKAMEPPILAQLPGGILVDDWPVRAAMPID